VPTHKHWPRVRLTISFVLATKCEHPFLPYESAFPTEGNGLLTEASEGPPHEEQVSAVWREKHTPHSSRSN